ncbi:MAG: ATP-binding cassette domain-containing protein [Shewanella sp.]|nr:ATP-binding cassette domain-containing protein [Shewanella sp.]MCF1429639.1 ATP-binding cassette domain-containing protein [Shewanella sp.]MCF1438990.1 ATP-binding cassette domain-containing protein [Shewanella sp.]MCF1457404.1 ATP-binding cassette domain-containing protein [Shewanella sp.]
MLRLHNVTVKRGRNRIALPDIELRGGDICGLRGPSGVGKSTLASVLAGMTVVTVGEVTTSEKARGCNNPVQWVIQQGELAFNPRLTLAESLEEAWHGREMGKLVGQLEIDPSWLNRCPGTLSGGQLQRINLLRALNPDTRYILCDEVTAQLDVLTQQKIWRSLQQIATERNLGMLVISHDEHLLTQVCQRIIHWPAAQ